MQIILDSILCLMGLLLNWSFDIAKQLDMIMNFKTSMADTFGQMTSEDLQQV